MMRIARTNTELAQACASWLRHVLDNDEVFHRISILPSCDSSWLRLRLSLSLGLIDDTPRRGTWPRHRRALVQPCRATTGTLNRTVRERALAPLSHRSLVSRKHPGSQGRR